MGLGRSVPYLTEGTGGPPSQTITRKVILKSQILKQQAEPTIPKARALQANC